MYGLRRVNILILLVVTSYLFFHVWILIWNNVVPSMFGLVILSYVIPTRLKVFNMNTGASVRVSNILKILHVFI